MEIVRALPVDTPELSAIAQSAKAHWGYPADWLERWREQLTITPEFVTANDTFAARVGQELVAFYALLETADGWELEHLWVRPGWMRQGIGRRLFTHAAAHAAGRGATCLKITADPQAEPFYLHLGAQRVGTSRSEIGGQPRELPILRFALPGSLGR